MNVVDLPNMCYLRGGNGVIENDLYMTDSYSIPDWEESTCIDHEEHVEVSWGFAKECAEWRFYVHLHRWVFIQNCNRQGCNEHNRRSSIRGTGADAVNLRTQILSDEIETDKDLILTFDFASSAIMTWINLGDQDSITAGDLWRGKGGPTQDDDDLDKYFRIKSDRHAGS